LSEEVPVHVSRATVLLTATLIAASLSTAADAAILSLLGNSTTVCQLIGETIWDTGTPGTATAAKTLSNFGLGGVDLGFPVDSGSGPLYFLFGDGVPPGHPPNSLLTVPPDDALGYTSRTTPPDSVTCLDLQLATSAPKKFAHPMVAPTIQQGSFNVPTGGVFFDNTFYAFFWTDHCLIPSALTPNKRAPLRLPAPGTCPETPQNSSTGRSVLAAATALNPLDFHWQPPPEGLLFTNMPSGFVYASAANPPPGVAPPTRSRRQFQSSACRGIAPAFPIRRWRPARRSAIRRHGCFSPAMNSATLSGSRVRNGRARTTRPANGCRPPARKFSRRSPPTNAASASIR
jgi:hypothetical protein